MSRKIKVDLTGVESFQRASEGKHNCRIASAELKTSQSGNEMITVAYEVAQGEDKGARVYENYPLVENALWKLKGMLQAIGIKADGKVQLDLDKLIGKMICVNVIHEEYEGQLRARVESVMRIAADEIEPDDEEDEEDEEPEEKPVKKAASKKAPMNPPADEDEDDWDDDDDEDEEPAPKKKASKSAPAKKEAPKKSSKKSEPEEDEDDWDDDDDEDWDEE